MIGFLLIALGCAALLSVTFLLGFDDHHSAQTHDHGVGSFLSVQSLLLFGIGFGSVGAVGRSYDLSTTQAMVSGVIFGIFLGGVGVKLTTLLRRGESDSTPSMSGLVGQLAVSVGEIHPESYGEIRLMHLGKAETFRATCDRSIPGNSAVRIDRVHGHDVHVTPV